MRPARRRRRQRDSPPPARGNGGRIGAHAGRPNSRSRPYRPRTVLGAQRWREAGSAVGIAQRAARMRRAVRTSLRSMPIRRGGCAMRKRALDGGAPRHATVSPHGRTASRAPWPARRPPPSHARTHRPQLGASAAPPSKPAIPRTRGEPRRPRRPARNARISIAHPRTPTERHTARKAPPTAHKRTKKRKGAPPPSPQTGRGSPPSSSTDHRLQTRHVTDGGNHHTHHRHAGRRADRR